MDSIAVSAYYSGARASSAVIRLHLDRATIPNSRKHRTFVCVCVVHCSIVHGEERRVYTNQSCWARQTVSILYTKCRRKLTRRYTLTAFTYPKQSSVTLTDSNVAVDGGVYMTLRSVHPVIRGERIRHFKRIEYNTHITHLSLYSLTRILDV